ncbi:hypothetical protein GCM10009780_19520 [Actinomadura alba]
MLLAPLVPLLVVDIALVIGGMASEPPSAEPSWTAVPASLGPAAKEAAAGSDKYGTCVADPGDRPTAFRARARTHADGPDSTDGSGSRAQRRRPSASSEW